MKKTIAVFVCVVVLLSCLNIFAAGTTENIILPQIGNNPSDLLTNGLVAFIDRDPGNYTYRVGADTGVVAACFCYTSLSVTHLIVATDKDTNYICWLQSNSLNDMSRYHYEPVNNNYDSTYNLYYKEIGSFASNYNSNQNCYIASSLLDGLAISRTYIDNTPQQIPNELTFNLPAGNVAYIRTDSSIAASFTLRCTMPSKNALFSSGQQWNSTQRYGWSNTLPDVNTGLTSFGSQIPWIVDTNKTNILGQTNQAIYGNVILGDTSTYFVVVNPLYYAVQYGNSWGFAEEEANAINNGSIDIVFHDAYDIVVYPLTQNVSVDNNVASYTNTISGQPYSGEIDPSTGDIIWTDPDGGTTPPQIGGGNIVASDTSSFKAWLQTLLSSITNIFQPAHDAITTLASAVSNFASWLYALYIWLPSPVLSVLTSAITLAIIIGVVKVFI